MHRHVLLGGAAWVIERFGTLVPREGYRWVVLDIVDDQLELTMATHRTLQGECRRVAGPPDGQPGQGPKDPRQAHRACRQEPPAAWPVGVNREPAPTTVGLTHQDGRVGEMLDAMYR